jgi:hypothetical protein
MKNEFHEIPAEIRKISNKRSKVRILLQLLGIGCKLFLHYTILKYKSDCMRATTNDYCMQNALQHMKINGHTYLSSRHIGLSWTICRLTFGPTRSRMLFSPYLIIVGLQENWKCIRCGSKHFCNKCHNHFSNTTFDKCSLKWNTKINIFVYSQTQQCFTILLDTSLSLDQHQAIFT